MKTNNTYTKEEIDNKIKKLENLKLIKKRTKTELTKDINSINSQIEDLKTLDLNQTKIL